MYPRMAGVLIYEGDMVYNKKPDRISLIKPHYGSKYRIEIREIGEEAFVFGDFWTHIYRSVDEVFEDWAFPKGSYKNYRPGSRISSLDELATQEKVVVYGKTYDMGWVMCWQLGRVRSMVNTGVIRMAVPLRKPDDKEEKHDKKDD